MSTMRLNINLRAGELWRFDGLAIRFEREVEDGILHFQVDRTRLPFMVMDDSGDEAPPTWDWFAQAFSAGSLQRVKVVARRTKVALAELDPDSINAKDPRARERAFVTRALDEMKLPSLGPKTIERALDDLWRLRPQEVASFGARPSENTVRRWMRERGQPGERHSRQMMSLSGRASRAPGLPPLTNEVMDRWALRYWSSPHLNKRDAFARMVSFIESWRRRYPQRQESLTKPGRETFRKRINALENYETYKARYGPKKAKARFGASGLGLKAQRILRLGLMDHTLVDGWVVLDLERNLPLGRPWVTALEDVKSRCIVGLVLTFEPPSLYSVMECIKRANAPKVCYLNHPRYWRFVQIHGRFDEIIVDNGMDFAGTSFQDAMADIGTTLTLAPVRSPTSKAPVERFFGTLNTLLWNKLPGRTMKPELCRELDFKPGADAVLSLKELEDLLNEAIGLYHFDLHTGIDAVPGAVWERDAQVHGIDFIDDVAELEKMAGALAAKTLSRTGIRLHGLQYHDRQAVEALLADLADSEGARSQRRSGSATARVKLKYNPANLGEVHIWNDNRGRYETLPCTDPDYAKGLSLWHHRQIRDWAVRANRSFSSDTDRLEARAELSRKIEAMAPDLVREQRRKIARLVTKPVVQDRLSGVIEHCVAEGRHDGMAPVIPTTTLSVERQDATVTPKRPPRRRKRKSPPKKVEAKAVDPLIAGEVDPEAWRAWRGFGK